ncbi:MAG TPA: type IV secretion system protein [Patescibacteria group bacterium]|jgi:uncharacterized membrane protein YgcG
MNKRIKRLISTFLAAAFLATMVGPAIQPAYAITLQECKDKYPFEDMQHLPPVELTPEEEECFAMIGDETDQIQEDNKEQERWEGVKRAMNAIGSRKEAQLAFFGESNEGDPGGISKLDINAGQDGEPSDFRARGNASIGSKYDGNPYFYVHSKHLIHNPNGEGTAVGHDDVHLVRFVLTDIHNNSTGDVQENTPFGGGGNDENIIYVFRNEFNPALNVSLKANNGRFSSGNDAFGSDEMHFSFTASCAGTFAEDAWASDIEWSGGLDEEKYFNGVELTDQADDQETIDEVAEKFNGINRCTSDHDFFAQAMQKALEALKVAISDFFDFVKRALLNVTDVGTLTDNQGLVEAWKTIRDFVNVIFILILCIVALSNILRIDTDRYGIRALLPRLIFGVIAVNFSFVLVQILTNVAFIIAQPFASKAFGLLANPPVDGSIIDPQSGIGQVVIAVLMVIVVAIAMLILFIFLVVRILMIWLLTALSPFVFLFMILPFTRSLASSWWKNAMKWIFMAPVAFMLLFVAAEIVSNVGSKNQDINGPDFLLKIAFFVGALIAAVMIPLKLGGEVMGRAASAAKKTGRTGLGAGKGLGGVAARKSGLAAANDQRKQRAERKQALRGAGIRSGFNKRLSAATGGRLGGEAGAEAAAQMSTAQEKEAQLYADQFDTDELERMQGQFQPNSKMHDTLGLAHDIRTGAFAERRKGEQLANETANFAKKPLAAQQREIQDLGSRNVTQFSPEVLTDLATTKDPNRANLLRDNLSVGAVEGILEQNSPARVQALRKAYDNGKIPTKTIDSLSDKHGPMWDTLIANPSHAGEDYSSRGSGGGSGSGTGGSRTSGTSSGGVVLPEGRRTKDAPDSDDIRGI